jgi:predicted carbohydrate-binding protein with CBM48
MSDAPRDPLIDRVAAELRRPAPASPGFDARVMAAVRAAPPSLPARTWAWLAEPRAVALSPLGGLALAAGVAVLVIAGAWGASRVGGPRVAAPATAGSRPAAARTASVVTFVLVAPRAASVALAGDFDGWNAAATPLRRTASGLWSVDVPLAPGRYRYAFVVDGRRFVADPSAPPAVDDDFGQPTSVVTVGGARAAGGTL